MTAITIIAMQMLDKKGFKPDPELRKLISDHAQATKKLSECIEKDPYALQRLGDMLFKKPEHPYEQFLKRQKRS